MAADVYLLAKYANAGVQPLGPQPHEGDLAAALPVAGR